MRPPRADSQRGWAPAGILAAGIVTLDQASKALVDASLESGERVSLALGIDLVQVSNRGIAFGLLGDGGTLVLVITIAALAGIVAWFALARPRPGMWLAVGLLCGGALGNLIDRARQDAVTDFIDPPLWPAFNLADVAITLGAVALVLGVFAGPDEREAAASS